MKLLFIRHGIAQERDTAERHGAPDALRSLTEDGRKKFAKSASGLRANVEDLALIATSPLLRAVQTAELLSRCFGDAPLVETVSLSPGAAPSLLFDWLREQARENSVALVGHEPDLGRWISRACAGVDGSFLQLKKGGACLVDFPDGMQSGAAALEWVLTPRQLRRLGPR